MTMVTDTTQAATTVGPRVWTAPGRVNLIGEHTDYTGGLVMPMAIPFATSAEFRSPDAGQYVFTSDNFPQIRSLVPGDRPGKAGNWSDYPVGVLLELQTAGVDPPPFHLHISGDVPLGAGLSSSASLEVATAVALLAGSGRSLPVEEIATLCRRAENDYVGSPCGIMDQFIITAATAGHALLLNTRDLTYELLPLNEGGLARCCLVVANSGVKHSIAGGDYGLRRRELEAGQAAMLQAFPELRDLGDATLDQLETVRDTMAPESYRRCRHVISENGRVRSARKAMLAGDPQQLGTLMTAAHRSERDDFECSVEEIDFLVDTALSIEGCFGARLTGGGFGGCTVNLVLASQAESFSTRLQAAYQHRYGLKAATYTCQAVDGAVARAAHNRPAQQRENPC